MPVPQETPALRLGWIGTGVMGASMCCHLLRRGYQVTVTTRSKERAEALLELGALWASSPAEVAEASDAVFSIVGFPRDVRDVILGDRGVLAGARPDTVIVDMTTSEPSLAVEIYDAARARDVASIDAPVSGGDTGAREGTLSIMLGGDEAPIERIRPALECMGSVIVHHGGPGSGQHAKMVNQMLVAAGMVGIAEALLYARRSGLDFDRVLETVTQGAAASWSLSNYAPRINRGDFAPGFRVEHFIKDIEVALQEARGLDLALPGLALAHELYIALRAQGHGGDGTHSLILSLAQMSNLRWDE